jgi:hypothetical protein
MILIIAHQKKRLPLIKQVKKTKGEKKAMKFFGGKHKELEHSMDK